MSKKKILIVYNEFPPIAKNLAKSFGSRGYVVDIFYGTQHIHWFYKRVIKVLTRWARAFRLMPKGKALWPNHHLSFYNYIDAQLQKKFNQFLPDYLLVIHGLPFSHDFIGQQKIPKIGWWVEPTNELVELEKNAKPFDIYNSFSLSSITLLKASHKNISYLSHAVSSEVFYPEALEKDIDIAFVGNWSDWRDEVLLRALKVTKNIKIYGPQWLKKSRISKKALEKIYGGEFIDGNELNHLINRSKINLNASRIYGASGLNMRFFEVLATKSFFLTDFVPEIQRHFVDGQDLVIYQTLDDLELKLKQALSEDAMRFNIAENGYRIVLNEHTYDHVAKNFLEQFDHLS